jgi:hypothetical protein
VIDLAMKIVKIREEHYLEAVAISQELGCSIGEGLRHAGARAYAASTNPGMPQDSQPKISPQAPKARVKFIV